MNQEESSQVEQNFLIALERTAIYHYKLALLRKSFRALSTWKNKIQPIREAYRTMIVHRIHFIASDTFYAWKDIAVEHKRDREQEQLALQFHYSVLAARAIDRWKKFVASQLKMQEQMVCFITFLSFIVSLYGFDYNSSLVK